jgi:hypothetical protein
MHECCTTRSRLDVECSELFDVLVVAMLYGGGREQMSDLFFAIKEDTFHRGRTCVQREARDLVFNSHCFPCSKSCFLSFFRLHNDYFFRLPSSSLVRLREQWTAKLELLMFETSFSSRDLLKFRKYASRISELSSTFWCRIAEWRVRTEAWNRVKGRMVHSPLDQIFIKGGQERSPKIKI